MKKMKKLVSVVMSVAMVYSLTGSSSGGKESAAPESKPAETQTPASGESSDGAQAAADSSNPIKIGFFSPLTSACCCNRQRKLQRTDPCGGSDYTGGGHSDGICLCRSS